MGVQKGRNATSDKKKWCLAHRRVISEAVNGGRLANRRVPVMKAARAKKYFVDFARLSEVYDATWQTGVELLTEVGTSFVTPLNN